MHVTWDAEIWGWFSLAIAIVSYLPYFTSIFAGRTRPHAFSWFVWGPLMLIAFLAQDVSGAGPGAWVTGLTGVLNLLVGVLALFYGERDITRSDWLSFAAALAVIPVWYVTHTPFIAVLLIILIDALGFYPTIRKTLRKPQEECLLTYGLSAFQFFVALFALERFSWTAALYPLAIVLMNGGFVCAVLLRRRAGPA
jgi:hypothetical protein